jgi:hypothetical protein
MCARGPQADARHRQIRAAPRSSIRKTMPHCALGHLRVTIRQGVPAPRDVPGLYEIILEGTYAQAATGYV